MKFCQYCGKQLQDNEVCSCQQTQAPVQQADSPAQAQSLAPVANSGAVVMDILNNALNTLKSFFTTNYEKTIEKAKSDNSHHWAIFTALALIFSGLSNFEIADFTFGGGFIKVPFFSLFFMGFLTTTVVIFAMAAGLLVISNICQSKITFINALNISVCVYLPVLLGTTLNNILVTFVPLWIVMIISLIVHSMAAALLFLAVKSIVPQEKSSFLFFTVLSAVVIILGFVVIGIFASGAKNPMSFGISGLTSFL